MSASGRVTRFYRAPFLKDDRLLDMIGASAAKIFLLRPPPGAPLEPFENGFRRRVGEVTFFYGGRYYRLTDVYGNVVKDLIA